MQVEIVVDKAKQMVPAVDRILEKAINSLEITELSAEEISIDFGNVIERLESRAFEIYQKYEDLAFRMLIVSFKKERKLLGDEDLEGLVKAARMLESSAGQMRKSRGGSSFQKIIHRLLNLSGVPCEAPSKETRRVLRRIDLVSPSAEVARVTPDKAIFIAAKRTLRERWKQVVPEQMKGARLYLVTMDKECSQEKAEDIRDAGMVAYVPEALKKKSHLRRKPWIRTLAELPEDIGNSIPRR